MNTITAQEAIELRKNACEIDQKSVERCLKEIYENIRTIAQTSNAKERYEHEFPTNIGNATKNAIVEKLQENGFTAKHSRTKISFIGCYSCVVVMWGSEVKPID